MKLWNEYMAYAERHTASPNQLSIKNISYWREKLFTAFSTYFVPISLIALVPGVWMGIYTKHYGIAWFDSLAALAVISAIFNDKISLKLKMLFVAGILYILALFLIASLGLFGPGVIYLLAITVFLTLVLPVKWGYGSIVVHFIVCIGFGLCIHFNLLESLKIEKFTLGVWIAFSSNLLFLSLVCVILVDKIVSGLESTITLERELQITLQKETNEKNLLDLQLLESEQHYKSLFILNPSPMWVIDSENFEFLQVNEAAIENYGYSGEEFLSMTIRDIRFEQDNAVLIKIVRKILANDEPYSFTTTHYGKDQVPFPVDMRYCAIPFKGKKGLLGTARNITEQLTYITAIEVQNSRLREIGFIQSHVVRAPLSRIMGLMDIFMFADDDESKREIIGYLIQTVNEFDDIVKDIISKVQIIDEVSGTLNKKKH